MGVSKNAISCGAVGIYTSIMLNKIMGCSSPKLPLLLERGEGNKINQLYSPSSQPSPSREKELVLV